MNSMVKINLMTDSTYECNFCGIYFNIKDAWKKKGNQYFCSQKCVLDYSELNDQEKIREGD